MFSPKVLRLIDEINASVRSSQDIPPDNTAREHLLLASRQLVVALESPFEALRRFSFQPYETAALRVAVDLNIFDAAGENPIDAIELANVTGADRLLIVRIMRVLSAMGVFTETGVETYKAGPIARTLVTTPSLRDNITTMFDLGTNAVAKLPEYLGKTGFKNPTKSSTGLWQLAFHTQLSFWDWLKAHPEKLRAFNSSMVARRQARGTVAWFKEYPVEDNLLHNMRMDEAAVLLVDVGGGWGQDLTAFQDHYPEAPGRLVLQDLPQTIDQISEMRSSIQVMKYSFLDPQPIIGARAYYFHHIFHDWPDSECRIILRQTASGMTKGYSVLLVLEDVLPDMCASTYLSLRDMHMMTLFASMERTRTQWQDLLDSEGFEIVKIWDLGASSESLIEAVLKD